MLKITIIAAPFGYGPATKALRLANHLAGSAEVTIITNGDPYLFICKYKPEDTACLRGNFDAVFRHANLIGQDYFISIGNEPAVRYLIALGMQARVIFIDSLFPWRMRYEPPHWQQPVRAVLVEDFPGVATQFSHCRADRVERVATIAWCDTSRDRLVPDPELITLSLGGVTSPLVKWEQIKDSIGRIISGVIAQARRYNKRLCIIGNTSTFGLPVPDATDVTVLADVSPADSISIGASSGLMISTPGIGTPIECMVAGVPVILLPPWSSTQLFQLDVYLQSGFVSTVPPAVIRTVLPVLQNPAWPQHSVECVNWMNANRDSLLLELPGIMEGLYNADQPLRKNILQVQTGFLATLTTLDALQVINEIIVGP